MLHRGWPLAFALISAGPAPIVQDFTVPSTKDGLPLHGQVDLPAGKPRAVVVMFQGSGNHRRDYDYAVPGSPQPSFLFRELAGRLPMRDDQLRAIVKAAIQIAERCRR